MEPDGGYTRQQPKTGKRYSAQEELLALLSTSARADTRGAESPPNS